MPLQGFNPCFNGSMYKNSIYHYGFFIYMCVSILVLMDLCIKTYSENIPLNQSQRVSILVLMDLCIKTRR